MSAFRTVRGQHAGFTLVELMVSLVLALLIAAAIGSIYLGSTQSFRTGTGLSQVQEGGRFTSLLITPVIRQAGYLPDPTGTSGLQLADETDPTKVFVKANNQSAVYGYKAVVPTAYTPAPSYLAGSDVLAITFVGQSVAASVTDSPLRTCLGAPVYSTQIAVNVLYVSSKLDAAGVTSLNCYTNVSTIGAGLAAGTTNDQPLISGVTKMTILYGIDAKNDGSSISYYNADQVNALVTDATNFTNPWIATNPWLAVRNIQITYSVISSDKVELGLKTANSGNTNIDGNGRLTSTVVTTIDIRNRLHN